MGKISFLKMIKPICDMCKKELDDFGALLFSPPERDGKVEKKHICKKCYENIENKLIKGNIESFINSA